MSATAARARRTATSSTSTAASGTRSARLSEAARAASWGGHRRPACTTASAAIRVTAVERSAVADATGSMHGFPVALTSFVGRAQVVDEVAGQLGRYRLVTV